MCVQRGSGGCTCNPNTQEAVAAESPVWFTQQLPSQPGLYGRETREDGNGGQMVQSRVDMAISFLFPDAWQKVKVVECSCLSAAHSWDWWILGRRQETELKSVSVHRFLRHMLRCPTQRKQLLFYKSGVLSFWILPLLHAPTRRRAANVWGLRLPPQILFWGSAASTPLIHKVQ